jgi:hypothetical protein
VVCQTANFGDLFGSDFRVDHFLGYRLNTELVGQSDTSLFVAGSLNLSLPIEKRVDVIGNSAYILCSAECGFDPIHTRFYQGNPSQCG